MTVKDRIAKVKSLRKGDVFVYFDSAEHSGEQFVSACREIHDFKLLRQALHKLVDDGMVVLVQRKKETGYEYIAIGKSK